MSGGIDSSYAAYLLKRQGHRVIGFTFNLLPDSFRNACNSRVCCSAATTAQARRIAQHLSIPHYVLNMRDEFERHVIERFVSDYRAGRTPNPCVLCNQYIKFGSFLEKARALGADRIATGHYGIIKETDGEFELQKGTDPWKDQSYFLYPIRSADLPAITFPLARLSKKAVRAGFPESVKRWERREESQDICFVSDGDYRSFVGRFIPRKKGHILGTDGRRLGYHDGVHLFTIGQRRGLGIPSKEPLYVVRIMAETNTVVVGSRNDCRTRRLVADNVNMLTRLEKGAAHAKIRYRHNEVQCRYAVRGGLLHVTFEEPVPFVSPGQSVVLYQGATVLGGGMIRETELDEAASEEEASPLL